MAADNGVGKGGFSFSKGGTWSTSSQSSQAEVDSIRLAVDTVSIYSCSTEGYSDYVNSELGSDLNHQSGATGASEIMKTVLSQTVPPAVHISNSSEVNVGPNFILNGPITIKYVVQSQPDLQTTPPHSNLKIEVQPQHFGQPLVIDPSQEQPQMENSPQQRPVSQSQQPPQPKATPQPQPQNKPVDQFQEYSQTQQLSQENEQPPPHIQRSRGDIFVVQNTQKMLQRQYMTVYNQGTSPSTKQRSEKWKHSKAGEEQNIGYHVRGHKDIIPCKDTKDSSCLPP